MDPTPLFPTFYVGAGDPNSGLQVCVASLTEPSSHPKKSHVAMAVGWALGQDSHLWLLLFFAIVMLIHIHDSLE